MAGKYRVRFVNFNYYAQDEFDHLDEAVKYVNSKGFEAAVEKDGKIVASKTTFGGWSIRDRELVPRSFTEIRKGDVLLVEMVGVKSSSFRKVEEVLSSDRTGTTVKFDDGSIPVHFDGLVFTKG